MDQSLPVGQLSTRHLNPRIKSKSVGVRGVLRKSQVLNYLEIDLENTLYKVTLLQICFVRPSKLKLKF